MRQNAEADTAGRRREIRLRFIPILGGVIVAYLILRLLGFVLDATTIGSQFYLLPLAQFIALFAGGFVSGKWAGVSGFMNGVAVAVVFIIVWAGLNAVLEARLVEEAGPAALPRMNMGGIILGDLLNLSAAAFGGLLSEKKGS